MAYTDVCFSHYCRYLLFFLEGIHIMIHIITEFINFLDAALMKVGALIQKNFIIFNWFEMSP